VQAKRFLENGEMGDGFDPRRGRALQSRDDLALAFEVSSSLDNMRFGKLQLDPRAIVHDGSIYKLAKGRARARSESGARVCGSARGIHACRSSEIAATIFLGLAGL